MWGKSLSQILYEKQREQQLLDDFAMAALPYYLSVTVTELLKYREGDETPMQFVCRKSYDAAEQMLAERTKRMKQNEGT